MTKVIAWASMSLDGYIADPDDGGFEHLFQWLTDGDVPVHTAQADRTLRTSAASAAHMRDIYANVGASVIGRRLFDMTGGWGGNPPNGAPVVVVTHSVPEGWPRADTAVPYTFVTDGIESAMEKARMIAGDKWVGVNGGSIARQCLEAGLLDEIRVDLVPVLLGGGVPFFGELKTAPVELAQPTVIEAPGVTHLSYRVGRAA